MFDIGFLELLMIGVVSLLVIGPERLPEVAAKVGKTVAKAQRFVRGVRSDINRELESGDLKELLGDQKKQIDELRQMVHTASKDIESSTSSAMKDAEKSFDDLNKSVKPPTATPAAFGGAAGSSSEASAGDSHGSATDTGGTVGDGHENSDSRSSQSADKQPSS